MESIFYAHKVTLANYVIRILVLIGRIYNMITYYIHPIISSCIVYISYFQNLTSSLDRLWYSVVHIWNKTNKLFSLLIKLLISWIMSYQLISSSLVTEKSNLNSQRFGNLPSQVVSSRLLIPFQRKRHIWLSDAAGDLKLPRRALKGFTFRLIGNADTGFEL